MKKINRLLCLLIAFTLAVCLTGASEAVNGDTQSLYLGGFPLGFDLSGDGALVVGLSEVVGGDKIYSPAKDAGIKSGDYIMSLDGVKINAAHDIDAVLKTYKGNGIVAEVISDGKKVIKNILPKKDLMGNYRLGVLIRDYVSGIGTVTFADENGNFCSLGHPIADESGQLLKVTGGIAYKCLITGVNKGERGKAGELKGAIIRTDVLGSVGNNTTVGLIGRFDNKETYSNLPKMKVGEAEIGAAVIYTTIYGSQPKQYNAAIVKVDAGDKNNKNLVIKITDDDLIKAAGGIVQGMSGSPIVQNGKIVGAVTHVFLNDATRGFGISVNNMLDKFVD